MSEEAERVRSRARAASYYHLQNQPRPREQTQETAHGIGLNSEEAAEWRIVKEQRDELIACLKEILTMQCETASGHIDSMGDSAYAEALRLLEKLGELEIVGEESNRCVIGRWKE